MGFGIGMGVFLLIDNNSRSQRSKNVNATEDSPQMGVKWETFGKQNKYEYAIIGSGGKNTSSYGENNLK